MATAAGSDELPEYRPVSRLAVVALAAGCGSSIVLITPLAAMLPIVAIALAAAALAEIRRSEDHMAGRWIALAGLAMAVGFASQSMAAACAERLVVRHRAMATATAWVEAVRTGRFADAIAISSPRAIPAAETDRSAPPPSPDATIATFRELPVVHAVAACATAVPTIADASRTDDGWVIRMALGTSDDLLVAVAPRLVTRRGQAIEEWLVNGFSLDREQRR
jgi:hypothetical protein